MQQLIEGKSSQVEAARFLKVSVRQVRRLLVKYRMKGVSGLVSAKRGKPSNRKIPETTLEAVKALIRTQYPDFGPTFATEKLKEVHHITLSVETIRKVMTEQGLWEPKKAKNIRAHPMRERRKRRGELVQIDGSFHDWFEGRSLACCLIAFIDDATGELLELQFVERESTFSYMSSLQKYIQNHGMPIALYSDKHSTFRINAKEADPAAQTQFSRALGQLGIESIHANSPQAKGRVERANQTLQDRLIKEMRLAKIDTQEQANAWLPQFMDSFNRRFSVKPNEPKDAHVAYTGKSETLARILSKHDVKTLSKNLSFQINNRLIQVQIEGSGMGMRHAKVDVYRHQDGGLEVIWKNHKLSYTTHEKPIKQACIETAKTVNDKVDKIIQTKTKIKPAQGHPWNTSMQAKREAKTIKAQFTHTKAQSPATQHSF